MRHCQRPLWSVPSFPFAAKHFTVVLRSNKNWEGLVRNLVSFWLCLAFFSSGCSLRKQDGDAALAAARDDHPVTSSDLYAVRHVNPEEVRFSPEGDIEGGIVDALATADKTIDIAMYSLSDVRLIDRLKTLAATVRVRLLLNQARTCGSKCDELEESGIDVRYVNPIMHHKFAIIDGSQTGAATGETILVTGSANWSRSAFTIYDEDWLRYDGNFKLVRAFQSEFNRLWAHSRDYEGPATSDPSVPVDIENEVANVLFTSANFQENAALGSFSADAEGEAVMRNLVAAIDFAATSVDVAHAHFRIEAVSQALQRAHERGVKVRILLDQQEYRDPVREQQPSLLFEEQLAVGGVEVRYKVYSLYWDYRTAKQMHLKMMLIDKKWVLTGSYNWSLNAERNTFENVIGIKKQSIVAAYAKKFETIWRLGSGQYEELLTRIDQSGGLGPCNFEPVALTPVELQRLRDQYSTDACR